MNTLSSDFVNSWIKMGVEYVIEKLAGDTLKSTNVADVIAYAMEIVETMPCTGQLKADFALAIIDALIWRMPESDDKSNIKHMSSSGALRNTIDVLISATKGEINVNKVIDTANSGCFPACKRWIAAKCSKK